MGVARDITKGGGPRGTVPSIFRTKVFASAGSGIPKNSQRGKGLQAVGVTVLGRRYQPVVSNSCPSILRSKVCVRAQSRL